MAERNIDQFAAKLSDPSTGTPLLPILMISTALLYAEFALADIKVKLNVATELRDNIDQFCNGPLYANFLTKLMPVFRKLLEGPPVFMSTSWEHVCILVPSTDH